MLVRAWANTQAAHAQRETPRLGLGANRYAGNGVCEFTCLTQRMFSGADVLTLRSCPRMSTRCHLVAADVALERHWPTATCPTPNWNVANLVRQLLRKVSASPDKGCKHFFYWSMKSPALGTPEVPEARTNQTPST